ncbi:MAG: exopolyphosphatase [Colwellia sp.]
MGTMLATDLTSNEQYISALDIGSNSFHFVLARIHNENLQILHSEKYQVKLADGLSDDYILSEEAIERGLQALKNIAPIAAKITKENFRVVATYTLRRAKNANEFLTRASAIFPYDIEVISGHEEARLVFQGASHYLPAGEKRLVIDIGGGSTELIIGKGSHIYALDSINIGCISTANKFFPNQQISKKAFSKAMLNARTVLGAIKGRFLKVDWQTVTGTSGTIKSIYQIINADQDLTKPIRLLQLLELKEKLLRFSSFDEIELAGLKENRQGVLCSGLSILIAVFETFEISTLEYCDYALREGVIFEAFARHLNSDIHQRTMSSLITRFNIDLEQNKRVSALAAVMFDSISHDWKLAEKPYKDILMWAIQLHEIGFGINSSGFHKHGKYIIENSDLPGFNQEQTQAIAWLVGSQRSKIEIPDNYEWYLLKTKRLTKILAILRLSCLLYKQRQLSHIPPFTLKANLRELSLTLDPDWQLKHLIVLNDLAKEQTALSHLNIILNVN